MIVLLISALTLAILFFVFRRKIKKIYNDIADLAERLNR